MNNGYIFDEFIANLNYSLIGNTSLKPVYLIIQGIPRKVYLKLESENPTGSVKDRTGYGLLQDLGVRGLLQANTTVIESTSGNLGVALAFLCKLKGYEFMAVIDPKTTQENIKKMQDLGAQIVLVDQLDTSGGYLLSRLERIRDLCKSSNRYVWPNQYENPANPSIHYRSTGPEIYQQMHGKVDALFCAVSTGGTLAGIGRFFRQVSPQTRIISVDAQGSVIFGTPPGPRKLTGIGSSHPSFFIDKCMYDKYILVSDAEAFAFCRALYSATNISLGGSSGAVLAACVRYLVEHSEAVNVVCLCADGGNNYATTIFKDEWLRQQGISLSQELLDPVQDISLGEN